MQRLLKGDTVIVTTGRDRGARGEINKVIVGDHGHVEYVIIEGVNVRTKHVKPNPVKQQPGGMEKVAMKIHASNVALYNPETKKADRIRFEVDGDTRKRVFVTGGQEVVTG